MRADTPFVKDMTSWPALVRLIQTPLMYRRTILRCFFLCVSFVHSHVEGTGCRHFGEVSPKAVPGASAGTTSQPPLERLQLQLGGVKLAGVSGVACFSQVIFNNISRNAPIALKNHRPRRQPFARKIFQPFQRKAYSEGTAFLLPLSFSAPFRFVYA